jgi:hypothetical protein
MRELWHPSKMSVLGLEAKRRTHLLTLPVKQIRRQSAFFDGTIIFLLDVPLVVRLERLLHLHLLGVPLRVMNLGFKADHLLRVGRRLVGFTSLPLAPIEGSLRNVHAARHRTKGDVLALIMVHASTMTPAVLIHVIILRGMVSCRQGLSAVGSQEAKQT